MGLSSALRGLAWLLTTFSDGLIRTGAVYGVRP